MYTLYYAPGAASLAVHWILLEIGAPFETVALDMERKDQKSPDYLKINPAGMIPTLIADGEPMAETAAILLWLAERHPEAGFEIPAGAQKRRSYLQTMLFLANTMQPAFRVWFYPQEGAGPANIDAVKAEARRKIEEAWSMLDARLSDGRAFLLGDRMTAPDFLATMLTRWSRNMPKPATAWPHVGAYVARTKQRDALREVHRREGLTDWIGAPSA